MRPLEDFLRSKPDVRLIGSRAGEREQAGVFSFLVEGRDSRDVASDLKAEGIGAYADDFYAARYIDAIGARQQNGVVRVSLVHYNAEREVSRLIEVLDSTL